MVGSTQGKQSYNDPKNWLEQECRWQCNWCWYQHDGRENDTDHKHLWPESEGARREITEETELAEHQQVGGGCMVHIGDFNNHSKFWDWRNPEWREAEYLEEMIADHRLVIGNDDLPTHSWMRNGIEGESIMDLSMGNWPFGKWKILDGNHAIGSDHEIIEWDADMEKLEEAGATQLMGCNLAAML